MPDKYKAVWLSHSSINNYEKCPRLYYLANVYKDKKTNNKITIVTPHMSLGSAVHMVLEPLMKIKNEERKNVNLLSKYKDVWNMFTGEKGGFATLPNNEISEEEKTFYEKGELMLRNVQNNFNTNNSIVDNSNEFILNKKSIRQSLYYKGDMIPNIIISQKENIILCGSIDWIVYEVKVVPEGNSVVEITVLDFKTGKNEESDESRQLPIYKILFEGLQNKWKVNRYAYYYLLNDEIKYKDWNDNINTDKNLDGNKGIDNVCQNIIDEAIKIGIEIREKRYVCKWSADKSYIEDYKVRPDVESNFKCRKGDGGCRDCAPYEAIINGKAKYVGIGTYGQDAYIIV